MLANGALSGDGTELAIRKKLIENDLIEAIIILPRNLFYTTDISVTLWIINKNKKARTVLQNGAPKAYRDRSGEIKKYIELTAEDRAKVAETFHNWQTREWTEDDNVPEYCYSAEFEEVKAKGFSLVPSKYIEFVNRDENVDYDTKMRALQAELTDLLKQEEQSKKDLLAVFKELGYEIKL